MSNQQKWTPGPWEWDDCVWDYDPDKQEPWLVQKCTRRPVLLGEMSCEKANARLIAASPTMADILEVAPDPNDMDFTNPERFKRIYSEWYKKRCAALAKARG